MASSDHRCDLLLVHAHLLTMAPVHDNASDDEGVGYIEDVRRFAVALAADPLACFAALVLFSTRLLACDLYGRWHQTNRPRCVVVGLMLQHSLFNKIKNRDPTAMPCWKSLRMATVEGAEAIGIVLTTHANLLTLVHDCCVVLKIIIRI